MSNTQKTAQKSLLIDGWEVVIGIEIHTQLATNSKIFSGSSTTFGQDPNTQASLVDLAMPGVLPVLNKAVLRFALVWALMRISTKHRYLHVKTISTQIRLRATKSAKWTTRLSVWVTSTFNLKMAQ